MSRSSRLATVVYTLLLSGCASILVSGDFQSGREALLTNNDQRALGYFQSVAQKDPNYVFVADLFREGVWTYLGRVQYKLGRYEEARQSFERTLSIDPNDNLARLYLGLTLARRTNSAQGLKEIQAGLQGLYDLLEYMQASRPFTALWDPQQQIRSEIKNELAFSQSAPHSVGDPGSLNLHVFVACRGSCPRVSRLSYVFQAIASALHDAVIVDNPFDQLVSH